MNSCVAQATVNGEPADAPVEGREEDMAKDAASSGGEETVAAGSMAPAVLFVAEPPVVAQEAPAGAEGAAAGDVSRPDPPWTRAAFSAGAYKAADPGADASAAAEPARGTNLPRTSGAPPQEAARGGGRRRYPPPNRPPFPLSMSRPPRSPAGRPTVPLPTRGPPPGPARSVAADPVLVAARMSRPPRPEGIAAELEGSIARPEGDSARSRIEPAANAPRGAEASGAPAAPDGKPSLASGEGDPETFSSAFLRESARADEAPEEAGAEGVFRVEEQANPNASPSVAAARNAGESVHVSRPSMPEPPASQAQRTFQAGENAFVLTRKSDTSMEVTLSPPGVGKLEIEIVLDKGVVNATITAADPAGRDAIERSLPQIVQALARRGDGHRRIHGIAEAAGQGAGRGTRRRERRRGKPPPARRAALRDRPVRRRANGSRRHLGLGKEQP